MTRRGKDNHGKRNGDEIRQENQQLVGSRQIMRGIANGFEVTNRFLVTLHEQEDRKHEYVSGQEANDKTYDQHDSYQNAHKP